MTGRGLSPDQADQHVTWRFWRWPGEIRRLRQVNLNLLRSRTEMHIRAGKAEGWIDFDDNALISIDRLFPKGDPGDR